MILKDILSARSAGSAGAALTIVLLASASSVAAAQPMTLTEAKCTSAALTATIKPSQIGQPVSGVEFTSKWVAASGNTPAHCLVNGSILPVDKSETARPIRFGVALPGNWSRRAVQMGGGGMNGSVPGLTGGFGGGPGLSSGFATYGSDSGHANGDNQWALNDEAIRNLGYAQLKKTHDVAVVLIERAYGAKPEFNYFVGNSQGGREALTVAQRFPKDYDGVMSTVPIVGFSSLMMSRAHMRAQEIPLRNWVPPTKGNAVVAEFMRRCDNLDGLTDGIINDYYDCRALFDVNDGIGEADPWKAKRCANDVDPKPEDATQNACLTSGQIETLQVFFSRRMTSLKLANGRKDFGMWAPTVSLANAGALEGAVAPAAPARGARAGGPGGGGSISGGFLAPQRYNRQEGAPAGAPAFSNQGTIGVSGFAMQDLDANPIELDEKKHRARLELISGWLDSTNPDFSAFNKRGGKLLVTVGTDDTTASSGEQLRFYQTVLDKMGQKTVDSFARLYVIPQGGHGLSGRAAPINGDGKVVTETLQVANSADRFAMLQNWVEKGVAPGRSEVVSAGTRTMPMCSYPEYPRYNGGDINQASSYACTGPSSYRKQPSGR
jgi:pimeloyl-ACP methyl ester carboxylesterase